MTRFPLPLVAVTAILLLATASVLALTATAEPEGFTARAGPDQTVECTSPEGALVTLDGSGSHAAEENDTLIAVAWHEGDELLGESLTLNVTLAIGEHNVTLSLMNSTNATRHDNVTIRVVDTTAPTLVARIVGDDTIWPPNHKMHDVEVDVTASDVCDARVSWELVEVASDEADDGTGDGHTTEDLVGADPGSKDTTFSIRGERAGPGDGREYTFVYEAEDDHGNEARATATVFVPHDMG